MIPTPEINSSLYEMVRLAAANVFELKTKGTRAAVTPQIPAGNPDAKGVSFVIVCLMIICNTVYTIPSY